MGRLKCHTQTFEDFYLSSSLIWLFGTNSPLKRHSKLWHSYLIVISCFLGFNIHPLLWIVPYDWCVTHMRHTQKICIFHLCMKKIIISGCYKLHLIIGINNVIVLISPRLFPLTLSHFAFSPRRHCAFFWKEMHILAHCDWVNPNFRTNRSHAAERESVMKTK